MHSLTTPNRNDRQVLHRETGQTGRQTDRIRKNQQKDQTGPDKTRQDQTRPDCKTRQDQTRPDKTRQAETRKDKKRQRDRETERQRDRETERQTDRQTATPLAAYVYVLHVSNTNQKLLS